MSTHLAFSRTVRLAAIAAAILAASCGGDDGGGGAGISNNPLPPTLVQITAQNQDAVARATAAAYISMGGVTALPTAAPATAPAARANSLAIVAVSKVAGSGNGGSSKAVRLSVVSQTESCAFGGMMTMTIDDRDNNAAVTAGDVLTLGFSQCRDDASTMLDGTLAVGIAGMTQATNMTQMSGVFTFQQLVVIDAGYTSSINGAMNATYTETMASTGSTTRLESTVAAGGLVAQGSTTSINDTFTYDEGFASAATNFVPSAPTTIGSSTIALNGTLLVASLGGRITLVTAPTTLVHQSSSANYPDSGQIVVLGNASQLRLTVVNSDRVRMELDANGDGTLEGTKEVTWVQLMP